jgi:hypothetical protein
MLSRRAVGLVPQLRQLSLERPMLLIAAKLLAVAVLLALDPAFELPDWLGRFFYRQKWPQFAVLLVVSPLCIAVLFGCSLVANRYVRTAGVVVVGLLYFLNIVYGRVAGQPLDHAAIATMINELQFAGGAVQNYLTDFVGTSALLLPIAAVMLYLPRGFPYSLPSRTALTAVPVLAMVLTILFVTGGSVRAFPSPFWVAGHYGLYLATQPYAGPRSPVEFIGPVQSEFSRIVMIVDESVRGDFLDINQPGLGNTPYLNGEGRIINFGVAGAISNCSSAARLALQAGLRHDQIPDRGYSSLRQPTIWQYAKRAGFTTILLDAISPAGRYHDFMTAEEALSTDEDHRFFGDQTYDRDMKIAEELRRLLQTRDRVFIYVNKSGTHFPYGSSYPPEAAIFPVHNQPSERARIVNDYLNATRWSVDGFFQRLLSGLELKGTFILYTSDHGQNLLDDGTRITHCRSRNPLPAEARVPLFALADHRGIDEELRRNAARCYDRAHHFQIFPTLLQVMGYDPNWVRSRSGGSLFSSCADWNQFYAGVLFGRPLPGAWVPLAPRDRASPSTAPAHPPSPPARARPEAW